MKPRKDYYERELLERRGRHMGLNMSSKGIDILEKFARMKNKSMANIIRTYMVKGMIADYGENGLDEILDPRWRYYMENEPRKLLHDLDMIEVMKIAEPRK